MGSLVIALLLEIEPTKAEEWFAKGRTELKDGRPAQALKSFEQAQAIEPALGTLLNIAECHERLGHDLVAWDLFNQAGAWAKRVREFERVELAEQRLRVIASRLVLVEVIGQTERAIVRLKGGLVRSKQPVAILPGEFQLEVEEEGFPVWSGQFEGHAGQRLVIPIPVRERSSQLVASERPQVIPPPSSNQKAPSKAGPLSMLIAGGGLTVAGATFFALGIDAQSKWFEDIQNRIPLENRRISADTFDLTRWGVPTAAVAAGVGLALVAASLWWWFVSNPSS